MAAKSREFLKKVFRKSFFYNEERRKEFEDFIDSFLNLADDGNPVAYKKWAGFITQSGVNDPVITELENTMGVACVPSRVAPGIYELLFEGQIPDVDKCIVFPNTNGAVTTTMDGWMSVSKTMVGAFSEDRVFIYSFYEGAAPDDGLLQNGYNLEIRVYP